MQRKETETKTNSLREIMRGVSSKSNAPERFQVIAAWKHHEVFLQRSVYPHPTQLPMKYATREIAVRALLQDIDLRTSIPGLGAKKTFA
jgi:hypothetical protein